MQEGRPFGWVGDGTRVDFTELQVLGPAQLLRVWALRSDSPVVGTHAPAAFVLLWPLLLLLHAVDQGLEDEQQHAQDHREHHQPNVCLHVPFLKNIENKKERNRKRRTCWRDFDKVDNYKMRMKDE